MFDKVISILGKILRILISFAALPQVESTTNPIPKTDNDKLNQDTKPVDDSLKAVKAQLEPVKSLIKSISSSITPKVSDWKDNETDYKDIIAAVTDSSKEQKVYNTNLSKYFRLYEMLTYNNGKNRFPLKVVTPTVLANMKNLCLKMDAIREFYGKPISITSGFRTDYWNRTVGGETGSKHLEGKAMDFVIRGIDPLRIEKDFDAMWDGGLGTYPALKNKRAGFNHFDISSKRRWKG